MIVEPSHGHQLLSCESARLVGKGVDHSEEDQGIQKQFNESRGSPASKNAPQHVADADMPLDPKEVAKHLKMEDPHWASYKKTVKDLGKINAKVNIGP